MFGSATPAILATATNPYVTAVMRNDGKGWLPMLHRQPMTVHAGRRFRKDGIVLVEVFDGRSTLPYDVRDLVR
jgi:hypothetical protein